jgi:hypothetical protein
MGATYKPNHAGFREMAVGSEIATAVLAIAEKGKAEAEAMSADFTDSGDYEKSFHVRPEITQLRTGFGTHSVATAILENTSDHAAAVEWGNAHSHKPHRVLGRVLDELQRHE